MPKLNADQQSLFEPIEVTLDGKEYLIDKVTPEMINLIEGMKKEAGDMGGDVLCRQCVILLGGEIDDYRKVDVRKIGKVLKFIMDEIEKSIDTGEPKNS